MTNPQVERVKRVGTALLLILAPLVYMIGQALQPDFDGTDTAAEQLPILVEHTSQGVLSMLVGILGLIFFIPAALGLMQLLRGRGAWLGLIGGAVAIAGTVLTAAMMTAIGLVPFELAENAEESPAGIEAALQVLIDNRSGDGAIGAYVGIGFVLLPLGLLLLAIGLWRARSVPRWAAVVIAVGALGFVLGVDHWIRTADAAVLLVGMGAVGVQLLRQTRAASPIAHAVDVSGVRPAHP